MDLLIEKNLTEQIKCDVQKKRWLKNIFRPRQKWKARLRKTRGKKREETYARPEVTSFGFGLFSFAAREETAI